MRTLRQMVAANVGLTLLPALAVKPPVAQSPDIRLLPFEDPPPSRRIALAWRRSSALDGFLRQLAAVFGELPPALFEYCPPDGGAPEEAGTPTTA